MKKNTCARMAWPRASLALAALLATASAHAHPGHGEGVVSGLLHPLLGIDHLLAILATGIWASQASLAGQRLLPASFVGAMGLAALAGLAGMPLQALEPGIAGSVLLVGLLIAFRVQMAPAAGALAVAVFAAFHGYAHGAELPVGASAWQYFAGFLFTTLLLLQAGLKAGPLLARWKAALPTTGAALAAGGAWMLGPLA
ncbi:MAG TPA: HupE/UreJ family protein [Noviherbaspirillum sp.]|nr:HupE/UreJ family protein [Noviherbaspirillum sp.]